MADSIKQQLDEIEVNILSLQRQLRASMDRFQALYTQVSGAEATTEGYKDAAQAAQARAAAAQARAEAAQAGAVAAKGGAVAAQSGAVVAQAGAEAARDEMLGVADTKVDKPTENLPPGQADLRVGAVNYNGQLVVTGVDPAHMFHSGGMDSAWLQTLLAWSGDPGVLLNTGISYQSIVQKPTGAVSGSLPTFGAGQALVDSGVLATSVSTAITQAAGAVRHDTAQALSAAAKAQALANIGLAAPVAIVEPLAVGIGNYSLRGTGGTWYCVSTTQSGIRLQFRLNNQFVNAGMLYAKFAFTDRGNTSFITVENLGSALATWDVTSSGGRALIDGIDVGAVGAVLNCVYSRSGSAGNWTANLEVNGISVGAKTGLASSPESVLFHGSSAGAGGWVSYLPHIHYWTY